MMRFPPALSTGQDAALRLDTIERAAKALTPGQVYGLTNLREGRLWDHGRGRAGGAVARMFQQMVRLGLVTPVPYRLTEFGRKVLAAKTSKSEDRRKAK